MAPWPVQARGLAAFFAVAFAALSTATVTHAGEGTGRPHDAWLLGDWGGLRTRLLDQGADFQIGHVSETAYNVSGGVRNVVDYTDQITIGATLDLERLVGLRDATFQVTYTERAGRDLDRDAELGTLQAVQEVYGRGQTVRLTEMWFEQKYFDRSVAWKWGRMTFGGEFAAFPCDFQNNTFCGSAPGNIAGNYLYNWPISQWAAHVRLSFRDRGYVKVGAYDQNPQYLGYADKLLPVFFPGSVGLLVPVELAWLPTFGGGTLPGSYKIGGWYSTASAQSVAVDGLGAATALAGLPGLARHGLYGGYLSIQQQVTRNRTDNPRGGLNVFLNVVIADSATTVQDRQVTTGFTWTGPFAARPDDAIAFAAGMTRVSDAVINSAPLLNGLGYGPLTTKSAEYVFELDYGVAVRPGLLVRPNLQYILSEGGRSLNSNVFVLGLKTVVTF
jgi:porin